MKKLTIPNTIVGKDMDDIIKLNCDTICLQTIKDGVECIIANNKITDISGKEFKNTNLKTILSGVLERSSNTKTVLFCTIQSNKSHKDLYDDLTIVHSGENRELSNITIIINDIYFTYVEYLEYIVRMNMAFSMFQPFENVYINTGTTYSMKEVPNLEFIMVGLFKLHNTIIIHNIKGIFNKDDVRVVFSKHSKLYNINEIIKNNELGNYTMIIQSTPLKIEVKTNIALETRYLIKKGVLTKVLVGGFFMNNYYNDLHIISYY